MTDGSRTLLPPGVHFFVQEKSSSRFRRLYTSPSRSSMHLSTLLRILSRRKSGTGKPALLRADRVRARIQAARRLRRRRRQHAAPQVAQPPAFYTESAPLGPYSIVGREAVCDVPMSSVRSRFEGEGSGASEGGVEGSPPGRPGCERRLTTSAPSSMGRWCRLGSWSCSWRGICSLLLKRGVLVAVVFSGWSVVEVKVEAVCCETYG